jgi:hypothetical protein
MKYFIMAMLVSVSLSAKAEEHNSDSAVSYILPSQAISHSGRTDSSGCHMDRKAGTRHCH